MLGELILESGPGRRVVRALGDRFWILPLSLGATLLATWISIVQPFAVLRAAARAGSSAPPEILFLAGISVVGLAYSAMFVFVMAVYLYALHLDGRLW